MIRVLVTGAGGRLGGALFGFLSSKGCNALGISREEVDLLDKVKLKRIVDKFKPEIIFHTAAMTNVDRCELEPDKARQDNVESTRNLTAIADELDSRLIFFSTDYVFDGRKESPYSELDEPSPISTYGRTKLEAEQIVRSTLPNYLIIRVSWLFGAPGDFVTFVKKGVNGEITLKLATDHVGSPSYISDLLAAIDLIAFSSEKGVFHLSNSGSCTRYEMGQEVIRLLGSEIVPQKATSKEIGFVAARPKQSVLSCSRYEKISGNSLRSWQEALSAYIKNTC